MAGKNQILKHSFAHSSRKAKIIATGAGYDIGLEDCGVEQSISVDQRKYNLVRIQTHFPSEHLIDGLRYNGEVELIHQADNGDMAIVSVFIKLGPVKSKFLQPLINAFDPSTGNSTATGSFNLYKDFARFRNKWWSYQGSLTQPPCTEKVWRFVTKQPEPIDQRQLGILTNTLIKLYDDKVSTNAGSYTNDLYLYAFDISHSIL